MKKLISVVLVLSIIAGIFSMCGVTAFAEDNVVNYLDYVIENNEVKIVCYKDGIAGDIVIPDTIEGYPVTSIGNGAFDMCTTITSVVVPESVNFIDDYAFSTCTNLKKVVLPDSLAELSTGMFTSCYSLEEISIPSGVKSIPDILFQECSGLNEISIPSGVVSIGSHAFSGTAISEIDLPDGLQEIENSAFYNCYNLKHINIPASVRSIGADFVYGCSALENINVDSNNLYYSSDDNGVLYNKDKTELIQYPLGNSRKEFVIPEGVVTIGKYSFFGAVSLESVVIPASARAINEAAFGQCYRLDDITFADTENSVTYIGVMAFAQSAIKTIDLPDSVETIDMAAFANCFALESITIPDGITGIDPSLFMGCLSLKEVNIPESVSYISTAFDACPGLDTISIPENVTNIDNAFITAGNLSHVFIYNKDIDLSASNLGFTVVKFDGDYAEFEEAVDGIFDALIEKNDEALNNIFSYIIELEDFEKIEDFTIHGYAGSTAEAYANEHGFNFVLIDSHNYVDTVITPATYTQAGVGGMVCDHCGDVQSTYEIPMLEIEESEEKVDKDTGVSVVFPEGTFDGEAQIEVTPVEDGEAYYKLISHKEGNYKVTMFDINVTVDGQKVQPNGTVLVQIPLPKGYNQNKCVVYYVADDGTMEELKTYHNKDGYVYFETNHFSYYAILEETTESDNSTENENELISYLRGLLNKYIAAFLKFIDMIKSLFGMK